MTIKHHTQKMSLRYKSSYNGITEAWESYMLN